MKTNFSLLFYLKKQKNYVSGNVPIYMRITVEGNRSEIATNRECDLKQWNAKGGRSIGSKEEIKVLNTHLDQLQNALYYAQQCVFDMGLPITAEEIKSCYLGTLENSHTLLEAVTDHNLKMEQLVGKDYVRGTFNRYKVLETHLKTFIRLKYDMADMDIRTIDQAFLNGFDHYLRSEKNFANNYVVKNIKNLGKILRICLDNEWIDKSPFTTYKGKTKNANRFYLNKEELLHIAEKGFVSERLQVRDVFIFCCFTGLAYVDVFKLKQENIRTGIDGERWIFTNRQKTKTRSSVPLLSTAVEIVDRYATNKVCFTGFEVESQAGEKPSCATISSS